MSRPAPAPSPRRDWRVHGALLVVQLAFASQAVEGKIAMGARVAGGEGISPFALAMVRMLGAAAFFQVFTRARGTCSKPTTCARTAGARWALRPRHRAEPDALPRRASPDLADDRGAPRRDDPRHGSCAGCRRPDRSAPACGSLRGSAHPSRGSHGSPASGTWTSGASWSWPIAPPTRRTSSTRASDDPAARGAHGRHVDLHVGRGSVCAARRSRAFSRSSRAGPRVAGRSSRTSS